MPFQILCRYKTMKSSNALLSYNLKNIVSMHFKGDTYKIYTRDIIVTFDLCYKVHNGQKKFKILPFLLHFALSFYFCIT